MRAVKNLLQVVPQVDGEGDRADSDNAIARRRRQAAEGRHARSNGSCITVKSVDKGVLLLSGEARSLSDHAARSA